MPSCEKYEELLQQYMDKALDSAQTAVLMGHLEVCSRCRLDFKLYQKVIEGLERLEDMAPPGRLTTDVMSELDSPDSRQIAALVEAGNGRAGTWLWALSSAAVAVVTVAGFLIFSAGRPMNVPAPEMVARQAEPQAIVLPQPLEEMPGGMRASGQQIVLNVTEGQAQVQRANSSRWEPALGRAELGSGDKIRTLPGASARIEYTQDKTTLKLRPSALVQILTNAVRVFHGDTWIRVDKIGSHFAAETPNAVASVRGTRYSAEVRYPERMARFYDGDLGEGPVLRKFLEQYRKNLTDARMNGLLPMMAYPMHATPVSLAVQVNMLLDTLNATREVRTNVQVFQSKVTVASLDPATHKELSSTVVEEGFQTSVKKLQLARLTPIQEDDFLKWGMPPHRELLDRVRTEFGAVETAAPSVSKPLGPASVQAPTAEPVSDAIDRSDPDYAGVERHR